MRDGNEIAAQFILDTTFQDLPSEVVRQAKRCILDLIGSSLGGSMAPVSRVVTQFASEMNGRPEASVWRSKKKVPAPLAVLANAFMASALDIDDGYRLIKGHPGAFLLPAALAVSEKQGGFHGQDIITAVVVGYEIGIRAGLISHAYHAEYHSSGSWGGLGTVAVVAKLLHFDQTQALNGLGIAEFHGTISPMMRGMDVASMVKDAIGWGAYTGIVSAFLAQKGFTGSPSLLGLKNFGAPIKTLGREFEILRLYFKPYATCRWGQAPIDGALKVIREQKIHPGEIRKITVKSIEETTHMRVKRPRSTEEAQFNIPFPLAAAILDGQVGPKQILEERLSDPKVLALAEKVKIVYDPEIQKEFPAKALAEVTITTSKGSFSSGITGPRGDYWNPLSDEEITSKFFFLADGVIPREVAEKVVAMVVHLEDIKNVNELIELIQKGVRR